MTDTRTSLVNRVTLADIAGQASVSLSTISKVLNGRSDVSAPTRARVEALLAEHGYLRRKTEAGGRPRLIHTVRGIGYVLRETPP